MNSQFNNSNKDVNEFQDKVVREVCLSQPFDFKMVKIIVKKGDNVIDTIMLERDWTLKNIPHFTPVIKGVAENEGIEISITANLESFKFIIKYLSTPNDELYLKDLIHRKITNEIFLNFIVTAIFLKVDTVYWAVINQKLKPDFVQIINECKLNLSNLQGSIVKDFATVVQID